MLDEINAAYDPSDPSKSINALLLLKEEVKNLPFKHQQLDELILACAGIWIETTVPEPSYAINDSIPVTVNAISRVRKYFPVRISLEELDPNHTEELIPDHMVSQNIRISARQIGLTQPYWLEKKNIR
ncbi:hypothetical protein [Pedobacter sp. NJ-S-72]